MFRFLIITRSRKAIFYVITILIVYGILRLMDGAAGVLRDSAPEFPDHEPGETAIHETSEFTNTVDLIVMSYMRSSLSTGSEENVTDAGSVENSDKSILQEKPDNRDFEEKKTELYARMRYLAYLQNISEAETEQWIADQKLVWYIDLHFNETGHDAIAPAIADFTGRVIYPDENPVPANAPRILGLLFWETGPAFAQMPNFKNKPRWFKRLVKPGHRALQFLRGIKPEYQLKTAPLRKLPNFLIIGAQRAGTTSLFHYLSQHPQIIPAIRKEIHFFDSGKNPRVNNFERGEFWYRSHFPLQSRLRNNKITFEATPMYLFHPEAPGRIKVMVPKTKIIVLLRNPVERAISHYFSEYKKGMEDLPMLEAFQREEQRLAAVLAGGDYKHLSFFHHTYKARGRYVEQLRRYKENFPADQILILQSEVFYSRPAETLRTIFQFLNINPDQRIRNLRRLNASEGKSIIERNVYDYLYAYFKPYNEALYEFIGRRYDWKPD